MPRERFLRLVASGDLTHEEMRFKILDVWGRGELVVVLAHGTNSGHWKGQQFHEDERVRDGGVRAARRRVEVRRLRAHPAGCRELSPPEMGRRRLAGVLTVLCRGSGER